MMKPSLVIMAAGMGSRYGGLKQIDTIDEEGHIIIDFSIYDAIKAGFEKIIIIIKKEIEQDFKERVGNRIAKIIDVEYVYQEAEILPEGYRVPEGRRKPWGTGHAIWCCKDKIQGPFAVINADDYYGREAFSLIYKELSDQGEKTQNTYYMVGYVLNNTLTEHGAVSRGVCDVSHEDKLRGIVERTMIEKRGDAAVYSEDNGKTWSDIETNSIVSMNLWGFDTSIMNELEKELILFLEEKVKKEPLKSEFFLPSVVQKLLETDSIEVNVLKSAEKWFGVTYKEDKKNVVQAIRMLKENGVYPKYLWKE